MAAKAVVFWQLMVSKIPCCAKEKFKKNSLPVSPNSQRPVVSFLLPVEKKNLKKAAKTIKSIQGQNLSNWQVVFCDLGEISEQEIKDAPDQDSRILFVKGRPCIDELISIVSSEFFIFCFPGDEFSPSFLSTFVSSVAHNPDLQIATYDVDENVGRAFCKRAPLFKPSQFSPELLLSTNYLSRSFIRTVLARKLATKIDHNLDFLHQEQELLFRLTEDSVKIVHIPQVLLHQAAQPDDSEQTKHVLQDQLERMGRQKAEVSLTSQGYRVKWESRQPKVSIIIPTRNSPKILKVLLSSIFSLTEYPNFEILLVDNNSTDSEILAYYEQLKFEQRARVIPFNETFNYSRAINLGVANSHGELLLFLNNDMQVLHADWLSELVQWALLPEIGVVGAKLLHPNQTIQHAGIVIGLQNSMGHLYLNAPNHTYGLMGSTDWYRNFLGVTGACQMMRHNVFEELGGYDEDFKLVFSDIDICLKAIQRGYRVLYDPFVTLIHYEGHSRGYSTPPEDILHAYEKLRPWLLNDDPYFSSNLTYTNIPKCQRNSLIANDRLAQIEVRRQAAIRATSK
jgi:GT2 family glycosyltransferase